uniref:Uncharacterized protein n=1 Tax=Streptomyces sp. W75 TaxID=1170711 RepID=I0CEC6_9ACTN|nr:hypothetical protein pCQ4.14 [Streptomyces sp. W75]
MRCAVRRWICGGDLRGEVFTEVRENLPEHATGPGPWRSRAPMCCESRQSRVGSVAPQPRSTTPHPMSANPQPMSPLITSPSLPLVVPGSLRPATVTRTRPHGSLPC